MPTTRLYSFFRRFYPILILLFLEIILFSQNYQIGTYLLGWDNLFPEMNFLENIRRDIFGVWLEYRGLGLLDGMSFAANLPHHIFLFLLSFFLPQSFLRYFFIFLMHFLGGVGMYFLLEKLLDGRKYIKILSFSGSIFYLFNIATIQMSYAPYEVFMFHFAFLPLLLLFSLKYMQSGLKKDLFFLSVVSIFSVPQAHVPTLFIVYFLSLLIACLFHIIAAGKTSREKKKQAAKRFFVILLVTFIVNSFWGLPYAYSTVKNAPVIANSKINQMATEDIYLKNKVFGNLGSVALLKGFSLDFVDWETSQTSAYMMDRWREHTNTLPFSFIGISFFFLALVGIFWIFLKKDKKFYPYTLLVIFTFLMLGNDVPVLSIIHSFFNTFIPYFYQIFRFTFTKFSILYVFCFSILFSVGLSVVFEYAKRFRRGFVVVFVGIIISFCYYSWPAWQGYFFYPKLRVRIPQEYFDLQDYFNTRPVNNRIALLPQPSYWGWTYNNWGYRGSGFIWYGLPQSSLDGAFYPWSRENENYFWEISKAIYSGDKTQFLNVLEKYQIGWILLDKSIITFGSPQSLYIGQIEKMLLESDRISLIKSFGSIDVYRMSLQAKPKDFVFLASNMPTIGPTYTWNNADKGYEELGNYISTLDNIGQTNTAYYPFRSLYTGKKQEEIEFQVEDHGDYFSFISQIPKNLAGGKLIIPPPINEEISEIDPQDLSSSTAKPPQVFLDGELVPSESSETPLAYMKDGLLEVRVPKILGNYSFDTNWNNLLFSQKPQNCNKFTQGLFTHEKIAVEGREMLSLTSLDASNCLTFDLSYLSQRIGYIVRVESQYEEGKALLFAVTNRNSQKTDIEIQLPKTFDTTYSTIIVPPMEDYGVGYNLYFDNVSIGRVRTVNNLGHVTVNPIPYNFLISMKVVKSDVVFERNTSSFTLEKVEHPNPSYYEITVNSNQLSNLSKQTLVLSQSFDDGWKAYTVSSDGLLLDSWYSRLFIPLFGKEIKDHVKVNNWENGWQLNNLIIKQLHNETIIILYLPQYLEYLGFLLLLCLFIYFIPKKEVLRYEVNRQF